MGRCSLINTTKEMMHYTNHNYSGLFGGESVNDIPGLKCELCANFHKINIQQGAISIDGVKINSSKTSYQNGNIIRVGKHHFIKVVMRNK